jgi:hypothetical protein
VLGEPGIAKADLERALRQAETSAPMIEQEAGRAFNPRPTIYLFASDQSFENGLQTVLRLPNVWASRIRRDAIAVAIPPGEVAANWPAIKDEPTLHAIHHELVHLMAYQRFPPERVLPAWLDEGNARLSETTLPGMQWRDLEIRGVTASLAATQQLYTQYELEGFFGKAATDGLGSYSASAEFVRLLEYRYGNDFLKRVFHRMDTENAIYGLAIEEETGASIPVHYTAFVEHAKELAAKTPAIGVARDTPKGTGGFLIAYGFPPGAQMSITMTGAAGRYSGGDKVQPSGVYEMLLEGVRPGTYHVVATAGSASAALDVTINR